MVPGNAAEKPSVRSGSSSNLQRRKESFISKRVRSPQAIEIVMQRAIEVVCVTPSQ
jgi:hypothetical protein